MKILNLFFITFLFYMFQSATVAQWEHVSNGLPNWAMYSLAYSGNNIFVGDRDSGVYLSTNNGISWTQTSLNNREVYALAVNINYIFAGTGLYGVYLSTNNGTNWNQVLDGQNVFSLAINGNYIFAGCTTRGLYRSTDNGISWIYSGLFYQDILALAVSGNNVFAGAGVSHYNGVYLSTDNGVSWTQTSLNNREVRALVVNGNNIFAGTKITGVYLSTDNGTSWTQTSLNNQTIRSLAVSGNIVFAGTNGNGVYVSYNNGTTWTQKNEGLGNPYIYALCIFNNYIFAGTGISVYRRTLDEFTAIHPISEQFPVHYALYQNYPNPFNPATKIKFSLPNSSKGGKQSVLLIVYDILGKEISTLVNKQLSPGTYEVEWNAANYSSGVYYYKFTAGDFTETKKMILIK